MSLQNVDGFLYETLKIIEPYLTMKNIVEVFISEHEEVCVETTKGDYKYFKDKKINRQSVRDMIDNIANYTRNICNSLNPIMTTYIPVYKYRMQVTVEPAVVSDIGASVCIRIGNALSFPLISYFKNQKLVDFIKELMRVGKTIVVSGGTSTGKTSCLNSLIEHIPLNLRIVTLENTKELTIPHKCKTQLISIESKHKAGESYRMISDSILRNSPRRIIFGELLTELTKYFLRMCNTGHSGLLTTLHADSAIGALDALLKNYLLSANVPMDNSYIKDISDAVQYVIQLTKTRDRQITGQLFEVGTQKNEHGYFEFHVKPIAFD